MSYSHSDFTLPGLSHRGLASWIVAISFAYSGQWNSRRLENHFHSFWNFVFLDLVDDLAPDFIVIPQFQLDILDEPVAADTSISTFAEANAKELTPDFSIAVFNLVRRHIDATLPIPPLFPAEFNLWRNVRVNMMKIPLIGELKRPPSRRAKSRGAYLQDLLTCMWSAQDDLRKQAEHAFLMQPSMDEIILVACCGEWWSWMISLRAAYVTQEFKLPQKVAGPQDEIKLEEDDRKPKVPELRTRECLPRPAKTHAKGKYRDLSPPSPSGSDKIPYTYKPGKRRPKGAPKKKEVKKKKEAEFIRYTELEEGTMECVKPNVEDAFPPENNWSLPILFGSEASAQHFFLIHRFLEAERLMPGTEVQEDNYSNESDNDYGPNIGERQGEDEEEDEKEDEEEGDEDEDDEGEDLYV